LKAGSISQNVINPGSPGAVDQAPDRERGGLEGVGRRRKGATIIA